MATSVFVEGQWLLLIGSKTESKHCQLILWFQILNYYFFCAHDILLVGIYINNPFIINATSVLREGRMDMVKFKSQGNQDVIQFKFSSAQIICWFGMYSLTRQHWKDISKYIYVKQAISIKKLWRWYKIKKIKCEKGLRQKKKNTT